MGKPMDYARAAVDYGRHRWPLPWKLAPMANVVASLEPGAAILDVGCGTGDYLAALHESFPDRSYSGFDLSPEMLGLARARCPWASLHVSSAESRFPAPSARAGFVYACDVLHHLVNLENFFVECARVLRTNGRLLVITDSRADIAARSLARLFPTTIQHNLDRYPDIDVLIAIAGESGLALESRRTVSGGIPLDERFMATLASRSLSELRLITDREHAEGMERARAAAARGESWLSISTALDWVKRGD